MFIHSACRDIQPAKAPLVTRRPLGNGYAGHVRQHGLVKKFEAFGLMTAGVKTTSFFHVCIDAQREQRNADVAKPQ
jgi:hypothetical protein